MFRRYVLFGLVAILALQGISANEGEEKSLSEKLEKQIEQLRDTLTKAIDKAQAKFDDMFDTLSKLADRVLKEQRAVIRAIVQKAIDQISKINEDAGDLGLDIVECVQSQEETIDKLGDDKALSLKECLQRNVERAQDVIDEGIFTLQNFFGFIDDDITQLHECSDTACYLDLVKEVALQLLRIPRRIIHVADHTILTIYGINKDMLICNADTALTLQLEIFGIVKDIQKCVASKSR